MAKSEFFVQYLPPRRATAAAGRKYGPYPDKATAQREADRRETLTGLRHVVREVIVP